MSLAIKLLKLKELQSTFDSTAFSELEVRKRSGKDISQPRQSTLVGETCLIRFS